MSLKKTIVAVAAVGALTAVGAVPAMALENEFHGMYKMMGYLTNAETGGGTFNLRDEPKNSFFAEQRARIMYIAKANDDLKLVTHFEVDARFGGTNTAAGASNKYPIGDGGSLDADRISLETKNFYLDFNIPATPLNMKVGLQPFTDAYQGVFGAFDATGVVASAKVGAFTPTLGWFRLSDNNFLAGTETASEMLPGDNTLDLIVVDGKFAINKDVTVGAAYYNVQNDQGANTTIARPTADYELLHMLGVNASAKMGPAALTGFLAYQFGDFNANRDLSAFAAAVVAKVAVGPGKINASALYLTGEEAEGATGGNYNSFRQLATNGAVSYFNPSNMWLLVRNGATINSSTAIGTTDLTKGNLGLLGLFGGYEMAAGKLFGSANIGYAQVDERRDARSFSIGTELNATVGYKVYDNLTASFTAAYLIAGDGVDGDATDRLPGVGVANADNPYLTNVQLSYVF